MMGELSAAVLDVSQLMGRMFLRLAVIAMLGALSGCSNVKIEKFAITPSKVNTGISLPAGISEITGMKALYSDGKSIGFGLIPKGTGQTTTPESTIVVIWQGITLTDEIDGRPITEVPVYYRFRYPRGVEAPGVRDLLLEQCLSWASLSPRARQGAVEGCYRENRLNQDRPIKYSESIGRAKDPIHFLKVRDKKILIIHLKPCFGDIKERKMPVGTELDGKALAVHIQKTEIELKFSEEFSAFWAINPEAADEFIRRLR